MSLVPDRRSDQAISAVVPSNATSGALWLPAPVEIGIPAGSRATPSRETRLAYTSVFVDAERSSVQATRKLLPTGETDGVYWCPVASETRAPEGSRTPPAEVQRVP